MLLMRTVWPTGSALAPKSLSTTVWPSTTTLVPRLDVLLREARARARIGQLRMSKYSGVVPVTLVVQFWSSLTSGCARAELRRGGLHRRRPRVWMAARSSQVSVGMRAEAAARAARRSSSRAGR